MNKQSFIKKVKNDCKINKVKFIEGKGKQLIYCKGQKVGGYFSDVPLVLAYAKGHSDHLDLLVHESSHMDQWAEKIDSWVASSKRKDDDLFDKWLLGKIKLSRQNINAIVDRIQQIEIDCEKRSVKKIKKYNLPIDIEIYIKKANSYIFLYTLMKENQKWPPIPPYRIKKIFDIMPSKFLKNYSKMSDELKELYRACYK